MSTPSSLYPKNVDLTNCDKEPIHILGKTQDHGVLLACNKVSMIIEQCSANSELVFDRSASQLLGTTLDEYLDSEAISKLKSNLLGNKIKPFEVKIGEESWILIAHDNGEAVILEFEPLGTSFDSLEYQQQLTDIVSNLGSVKNEQDMCDEAAKLIKDFLGYDRVMIYQFDANWNGTVVSEAKEERLESWLGLHYPSTDIPQQARKLFLKQGVRIIADVDSAGVPITSEIVDTTIEPLDLSRSELRAVSPIHIEYLQNMGVGATLTAAIVANNTLWGLIACHHYSPRFINFYHRLSCKFLTQVFSTQLVLRTSNTVLKKVNNSTQVRSKLIEQISQDWNIHEGLAANALTLLDICDAEGAAIVIDGKITRLGNALEEEQITSLLEWIAETQSSDLFATEFLSSLNEDFYSYKEVASGVLCVFISKYKRDALIWFKPEIKQTVTWAGNPEKAVKINSDERLSPRKSFEKWSEEQDARSEPWEDYEIAAVQALKQSISEVIIHKYEEVKSLNEKLKKAYDELESFSYSVSHDLRAPLRGIDGFAQIIKEDYYDSLDEYGKSAIETIINSTDKMNELIDDILAFSGLSQKQVNSGELSLSQIISEVISLLNTKDIYPATEIKVSTEFPVVHGDRSLIFQLVSNLIGNALKYSAQKENPVVEIGYLKEDKPVFFVKDNGIGFDEKHAENIFGVFNRLVGSEYEGSGIGLSIAKRVVEKHGGEIWVKSKTGGGTTFYFTLGL